MLVGGRGMKRAYYLFNPGRMSRKDNTLKFQPAESDGEGEGDDAGGGPGERRQPRYIPVENIEELFIFGELDANSALYNFLGKNGIPVHFFDYYEHYTGSFFPRDQLLSGKVQIEQTKTYLNQEKRLDIARRIIQGASFNLIKNLKYYENRGKELEPAIEKMERLRGGLSGAPSIESLMGTEGNIRQTYYEGVDLVLDDFDMKKRSKQPPQDEVNSLISFGNMLCYTSCLGAIQHTQLNPTISYLHEPGERRYSLALDLAEIFKPLLVDRLIFRMLNKKELQKKDFDRDLNSVLLKPGPRKKFVQAYEERLGETIQHRTLKRSVSYKYLIRLECYKLLKHILGMEEYQPFHTWW
jgi:CRISPR-associated protein Cas1